MAGMHIRYNEVLKQYEYSHSGTDAGPWTKLDLTAHSTTLPANIAFTNVNNNFTAGQVINGGIDCTSIVARSNIHNTTGAFIFPGRADIAADGNIQGSWFLGSHPTYGLWTNTGMFFTGAISPANVQSRDYISATSTFWEAGRGTALGYWIGFAPVYGSGIIVNNNHCSIYTLIGKTMILSFYHAITIPAAMGVFSLNFPTGTSANYQGAPFLYQYGTGMAQVTPGANNLNFYRDVSGSVNWAAGANLIAGTISIQLS